MKHMHRVVLTGGPGSGKTVVSAAIARSDPARFVVVPESATRVYAEAQTRGDLLDVAGRREIQRKIYLMQRHEESRFDGPQSGKVLIFDRGTVDGATYWPDGPDAFWADLGTSFALELARYDHVIWMQTTAEIGLYDGSDSNDCRFEQPADAVASGEALLKLWSAHSSFQKIPAFPLLEDRIAAVFNALERIPTQSR